MQTQQLGQSDLQITPIGFGAWAIGGGGWAFGWGPQEDQDSVAAIQRSLDLGVNWIDTAAIYGLGHSEEIVAKALKGRSDRPYIFTKCSMVWDETGEISRSLKADSIRREVEDSLRRLQVDVIDLYQIHWPVPDEQIEEGWETLAILQKEGKVRHIGVSNFSVGQSKRAKAIAPITSLQPPYSLVRPDVQEDVLPFCQEHGIGVIVYSPMQSGLLTGKMTPERVANMPDNDWRKRSDEFQEPRLSRNLKLVEVLRQIGAAHGRSPGEVAIAWTLTNPAVTAAIVGGRNPQQVEGIIGAADLQLTESDLQQLTTFLQQHP
ncbi:MAG: aldo/keto reductase [Kaiparowitsia implicata GSE-PSE-MK54-09C]|jgi:aryl-alcohol dehydrogenase-like predicted oxidoreductase|nr:aldo/keto reductase [Kaiparowitsia implicata GSE-PSE-MK54-09C]